MVDIDNFKEETECIYKNERYSVRDNGAVLRHPKEGKRQRQYDNHWTFGNPNDITGYMEIASVRVHIIVATAFHGMKPSNEYVVDHTDTNRRNNRVENLRWVTRLENALNNPITRKRIIMRCGSIEAFLANPSLLRENDVTPDFAWMRTVTEAESKVSKERLLEWAQSDKPSSGGTLGEWLYKSSDITENQIQEKEHHAPIMQSLTPGAAQQIYFDNDKPNEYPCTPTHYGDDPLLDYANNLKPNAVFWRNHDRERPYVVHKYGFSKDKKSLYVMTKSAYVWRKQEDGDFVPVLIDNLRPNEFNEEEINYQLAEIIYENDLFIHKRVETGFMPKEYLEDIFNECIECKTHP